MFSSTFEYISIIFNPPKRFPRKPTESRQAFLTPWILLRDINSVKPGMPRGRSLCVSLVPETKSWNRCVETNSEVYKLKMSGSKFLPPWTHAQHSDSTSPPSQNKKTTFSTAQRLHPLHCVKHVARRQGPTFVPKASTHPGLGAPKCRSSRKIVCIWPLQPQNTAKGNSKLYD